jgi:hypothetical protein
MTYLYTSHKNCIPRLSIFRYPERGLMKLIWRERIVTGRFFPDSTYPRERGWRQSAQTYHDAYIDLKWSRFVGINYYECFASDSTRCALGIKRQSRSCYQFDPCSLTSLPTASMVMVRRWSLSVVRVVIDLFVLVLIAALTALWVGHSNHHVFEANSYHTSRSMNIYFASQTRQVEILFQRQASDLTRRRSITSSSLGGGLEHCHIWLAVTCHLSSCYWLCLVSASYASPHIIPSWCDLFHDVLQRFFNLMPHPLYGPAVQTLSSTHILIIALSLLFYRGYLWV